jgi:hypothetical protein
MNIPKVISLPAEQAEVIARNVDEFILYYQSVENQCMTEHGKAHAKRMVSAFRLYADGLRANAR